MPVTTSAAKALRQDRKREIVNKPIRTRMYNLIKIAIREKTESLVSDAYSAIDRAAKKRVIHKNKAARLKSHLIKKVKQK